MSEPEALLLTPTLQIYPYARGIYPPDTLYGLWQLMHQEQRLRTVFYEQTAQDIEGFWTYFSKTVLFLVMQEQTLVGAVWFTEVRPYRGNIGLCFSRQLSRALVQEGIDRVCQFAFRQYGWAHIWGVTPWWPVVTLGQQVGFQLLATLPESIQIHGTLRPLYVGRRSHPLLKE